MKLRDLFAGVEATVPTEAESVEVRALAVDSRRVTPGALFAALPGLNADGADFAPQALAKGAAAVLAQRPLQLASAPVVVAPNARKAFSQAASRFHGEPSRRLSLFGVTGTNGKTTTAYLVEQLSAARGLGTGLIGTVECRWPGGRLPATHTTPESHELQELLKRMLEAGAQVVAMEVSSHALAQERVSGCAFAGAAFTNLTRDHLDYHGTLEEYFAAKAKLFRELLPPGAPAVLNFDDPRVAELASQLPEKDVIGFTLHGARGAALLAEELRSDLDGLYFRLRTGAPLEPQLIEVESPLVGAHNAENLLAALGLLAGSGVPLAELTRLAPEAQGAPGRLERVPDREGGRVVLVDYAHTDDALARVLEALRKAAGRAPRLICVFGCGGDRDRGKRPLMGRAAAAHADLVIATSDNPRSEDPLAILGEIEPGLLQGGKKRLDPRHARSGSPGYCIVPDRREAIELALRCAGVGDAVLIAGKGHETYQIVGAEKRPFDDRAEAERALREMRAEESAVRRRQPPEPGRRRK
ncbi:MAG: UDP-N-acetylmuramoyl-L-alanyl-D-glutamate--2,6-diaminopimelate ligase [Deltaproteobacteria bacterium]|nr:MAG: UDP-N-acetylmuramoyl-L-alanyl-D-glutamate--2,6-diaminopimelate ligase [Deltaproteobacteria bacterium]